MEGRSRLEIGEMGTGDVKLLSKVAPVDIYLAAYTDGNGKKEQRLVTRVRGTKRFYFLFPGGVESGMRSAAPWLQVQLEEAVISSTAPLSVDDVDVDSE
jgi:hypothetical protein